MFKSPLYHVDVKGISSNERNMSLVIYMSINRRAHMFYSSYFLHDDDDDNDHHHLLPHHTLRYNVGLPRGLAL